MVDLRDAPARTVDPDGTSVLPYGSYQVLYYDARTGHRRAYCDHGVGLPYLRHLAECGGEPGEIAEAHCQSQGHVRTVYLQSGSHRWSVVVPDVLLRPEQEVEAARAAEGRRVLAAAGISLIEVSDGQALIRRGHAGQQWIDIDDLRAAAAQPEAGDGLALAYRELLRQALSAPRRE
jgi:hypothetical protein